MKKREHLLKRIKYPKFALFLLTIVFAWILFNNREIPFIQENLIPLGYLGAFLAGLLFSYGFTTMPAIAIFLVLSQSLNPFIAALIGGFGALLSDSLIFLFIRTSFNDEIKKIEHEKIIRYIKSKIPSRLKRILLPIIAGLIIASPLPDEIGVSMLAAYRSISPKIFTLISYVMNSLGILAVLLVGRNLI